MSSEFPVSVSLLSFLVSHRRQEMNSVCPDFFVRSVPQLLIILVFHFYRVGRCHTVDVQRDQMLTV